jgi:hypothetical protein
MTTAVVFVLTQYLARDADRCIQHCIAQGYEMIGVVKDDWEAAIALTKKGDASIIVAASPDHVPPDREPRVEYVAYDPPRSTNAGPGISRRETPHQGHPSKRGRVARASRCRPTPRPFAIRNRSLMSNGWRPRSRTDSHCSFFPMFRASWD